MKLSVKQTMTLSELLQDHCKNKKNHNVESNSLINFEYTNSDKQSPQLKKKIQLQHF